MGKFFNDMLSLAVEGVIAHATGKKAVEKVSFFLDRLLSGEEIPVEEFLKLYDTRIHNFDSKRDDIKIMKQMDFEAVYTLHNKKKDIYYVGKSSAVLRKIRRHFEGYESESVYKDWKAGDDFTIKVLRLQDTEYENINQLETSIVKKYGVYEHSKAQYERRKSETEKKEKKRALLVAGICFLLIGIMNLWMWLFW